MKPYIRIAPLKQPSLPKQTVISSSNFVQSTIKGIIDCLAEITKRVETINKNEEKLQLVQKFQQIVKQQKNIAKSYETQNHALLKLSNKLQNKPIDNIFEQSYQNLSLSQIQDQKDKNRMEDVFQNIDVEIPENKAEIDRWMGKVCKKTISISFNLFKNGTINQNQLKAFCSENILRNLIYFAQKHNLDQKDVLMINQTLKQLFAYFKRKYPQTEEAQTSSKFSGELIERDLLNENQYDMVFRSKVKFNYVQNGNYNSQIMQFLNFIIKLPNTSFGPQKQGMNKTFSSQFRLDMKKLFQSIYQEDRLLLMEKYDPKSRSNQQFEAKNVQKSNIDNKQKQQQQRKNEAKKKQYEQRVKSYTSYLIGQKISQNFRPYDSTQIESGILKLKTSAVMRVVTKWCQQLSKWFKPETVLTKQTPFRLKNGNQIYFDKWALHFLNYLLQRQYQTITQKIHNITKNNYILQSQLLKRTPNKQLIKFSEDEVVVGQFASIIFKNNQNYLINYLNSLIHGINLAMLDFHKYLVSVSVRNYYKPHQLKKFLANAPQKLGPREFQELMQKVGVFFQTISQNYDPSHCPQLVTFKIGDLLRCKCSSKQREIIALYREIERISRTEQKQLKLLRVKNRLNNGNKDILMNLLYKDTILIEIQLAIKQQKSKFIQYSNKFNHYLYELLRAQFGPITQMCTIWMSKDYRSQFYLQKLQLFNKRLKGNQKMIQMNYYGKQNQTAISKASKHQLSECCDKKKQAKMTLPFRCNFCQYFYYDCSFQQKHMFCQNCKKFTCFLCQFQQASQQRKQKLIPYPESLKVKQIQICEQIPQKGAIMVKLKSKNKRAQTFYTSKMKQEYYFFALNNNDELTLIQRTSTNKEKLSNYLKQNLIYTSKQIFQTLISPNLKKANQLINQYFISKLLKQSFKNQKKTVQIVHRNITQQSFNRPNIRSWPEVKRLNLSFNPTLTNIQNVIPKFPSIQIAILNSLQMKTVPQNIWHGLKALQLQNNNIETIEPLLRCKQLVKLNVSFNHLASLPENIDELINLKYFQLGRNDLVQLPQNIGGLQLIQLKLRDNLIKKIPDSLCKIETLQELDLKFTKLQSLPSNIGSLKNLKIFRFCLYEGNELPNSFQDLKELSYLQLDTCPNITQIHQNLNLLKQLRFIQLTYCVNLSKLPTKFGQLNNLKQLSFYQCAISQIPICLSMLDSLQSFSVQACQSLVSLPLSIGKKKHLKTLTINQCHKIQSFGDSFGQIISIQLLKIKGLYKLKTMQNSFRSVESINSLKIYNCNYLQTMENSFQSLQSINNIEITSCMKLEKYPKSFQKLQVVNNLHLQSSKQVSNLMTSLNNLRQVNNLKLSKISQFDCFNNLQEVQNIQLIQCNYIGEDRYFDKIKSVKKLAFENCKNKSISNLFNGLQEANIISLKFCKDLSSLQEAFPAIQSLNFFKIYNCWALASVPKSFFTLNDIKRIELSGMAPQFIIPEPLWRVKSLQKLVFPFNQMFKLENVPFSDVNKNLQVSIGLKKEHQQKEGEIKQYFQRNKIKCLISNLSMF